MKWTAWNNGAHHTDGNGYGFKVSIQDRDEFFKIEWSRVVVILPDGSEIKVNTAKDSFWNATCRELISREIGRWLIDNGYAKDKNYWYYFGKREMGRFVLNSSLYRSLRGKILLTVERNGEAYYVSPIKEMIYYLGRPEDAFEVMRDQGIGITNSDLKKIPLGLGNLTGPDTDLDGLPDLFEDAIGSSKDNKDTDGDGHSDGDEVSTGHSPVHKDIELIYDKSFAGRQSGKIFLQVESSGEAWYVNPGDNKRYFLGRPADAFQVMRNLGLGISNENFDNL